MTTTEKSKWIRQNVRKGIDNIRIWMELKYEGGYPTITDVLEVKDNEWLVENFGRMVCGEADNDLEYEHMETDDLITELNRLRGLKRYSK